MARRKKSLLTEEDYSKMEISSHMGNIPISNDIFPSFANELIARSMVTVSEDKNFHNLSK